MKRDLTSVGKYLSYILRHRPDKIGITMDQNGWVSIDELIRLSRSANVDLSRDLILEVVAKNDKQRFRISEDGQQIRASQGHSISINLDLSSREPPEYLFHGTASHFLTSILSQGLKSGSRQYVHLSVDPDTAMSVGRRHGKPVVLTVRSGQMFREGSHFYLSDNGVWLTQDVPARYITVADSA